MLVFIEELIGERLVAEGATGFEERAVHVVDALGAGALVEIVYILGAEIEILRVGFGEALLDLGEGFVRGVGLGGAGVASALGVEAPDKSGVGIPGFGGGDFFHAMTVPEASGAAEGGEAAFGGDAGAR